MTTATHILLEEERRIPRVHSKRTWPKCSYSKVIVLISSALLALVFTLVYYGVFLGVEEILQNTIQSNSIQILSTTEPVKMHINPPWRKLNRLTRRTKRQTLDIFEDDMLDPMQSDFSNLRAKIRDKRTNIELSKLERDFAKCKREAMSRSDCMDTFKKMYKIAKDISEKMEKMKEMLRDSELDWKPISISSSMEKNLEAVTTPKGETVAPDWKGENNTTSRLDKADITPKAGFKKLADEDHSSKEISTEKSTSTPMTNVTINHSHTDITSGHSNTTPSLDTSPMPYNFALNATTESVFTKTTESRDQAKTSSLEKTTNSKNDTFASLNATTESSYTKTTESLIKPEISSTTGHPKTTTLEKTTSFKNDAFASLNATTESSYTKSTESPIKPEISSTTGHPETTSLEKATSFINDTFASLNATTESPYTKSTESHSKPEISSTTGNPETTSLEKTTHFKNETFASLNATTEGAYMKASESPIKPEISSTTGHPKTTSLDKTTFLEKDTFTTLNATTVSTLPNSTRSEELPFTTPHPKTTNFKNDTFTTLNAVTEKIPSKFPDDLKETTESTVTQHIQTSSEKSSFLDKTTVLFLNASTEGVHSKNDDFKKTTESPVTPNTTQGLNTTTSDNTTNESLNATTAGFHTDSKDARELEQTPQSLTTLSHPSSTGKLLVTETNMPTFTELKATTEPTKSEDFQRLVVTDSLKANSTTASEMKSRDATLSNEWTEGEFETTVTIPIEAVEITMDWGYIETIATVITESSENTTTEIPNHGERSSDSKSQKPSIEAYISNHTDVEITYEGKCGATNYEYKTPSHDASPKECPLKIEDRVTKLPPSDDTTKPPTTKKDQPRENEDHPLDYPSSRENMLDDHDPSPKPTAVQEEWRKKFEAGTVDHRKNLTIPSNSELMESFADVDQSIFDKFGPKMNKANDPQLMTLCERLAMQMRSKVTSVPEKTDDITPSPGIQFTSRGPGFPVTGETMKASAQFLINPNFGVPSIPVCFYITPASFRMMMQPLWSPFFGMQGMGGGNTGNSGNSAGGGIFFIPPSFGNVQNNGNFFGHSSPSGSGSQSNIPNIFSKSASTQQHQQKQQQFFCTYLQNGGKQSSGSGSSTGFSNVNFKLRNSSRNESSPTDIIYSSYWNKMPSYYGSNLGEKDRFQCPLEDDVPCYGGNECVPERKWCDSTVDCSDGSDEAACTCRKRLQEQKICDGYQDCPLGEDEIGCFGCNSLMYSCYDNAEEFKRANRSTLAMCYSSTERCDGVKNCINGRDETGCNLIVGDLTHHMSHAVSASAGFLYRNHQGEWYPVCNNAHKWAREACAEELGDLDEDPLVTFPKVELPGPFIEPHTMGEAHFPQSCQKREKDTLSNHVAHVRCPLPKCGIIQESASPLMRSRRRRHSRRSTDEENSRIVGGAYSKPLRWPFIVALYRNGMFHCGGTILNEQWIISAAHCTIGFRKYFFEVHAGVLRRSSFSASTQIHHVTHVVVHQDYERRTMKNDVALLRIDTPLRYNRWVKPICLPDRGRTTMGADWKWGPEVDTLCTVVGWGAITEKGPGSDWLKEVQLPIRKRCSEKEDQEAEDICAGEAGGGKDACQGDSGGPLFCRSVSNGKEWYLAGVVSHGNGCARAAEFGVYTRVALYIDWIQMALRPEYLPKEQPKQMCPGDVCIWGGKRCIPQSKRCDRLVDCLGGEDEVGCVYNYIPDVGASLNASASPVIDDTGSTGRGVPEATTSGFNSDVLLGDINGGGSDTEPFFLETAAPAMATEESTISIETTGVNKPTTTIIESTDGTTDSPHPGLKSLLDVVQTTSTVATTWAFMEASSQLPSSTVDKVQDMSVKFLKETDKGTVEITSPLTTASTSTTGAHMEASSQLPSSTVDKVQDMLVKFLKEMDKGTVEITTPLTTASTSTSTEPTQPTLPTAFGDFKANLADVTSEVPTLVHKRENATDGGTTTTTTTTPRTQTKTMPKSIAHKFVCKKIPQIIGLANRCDRIADCEDGTDEEGCTCRQYLKGPLNILICDGKIDCEDFTDEDDCGNCTSTEFLCPLSKTCIDANKRCDNSVDCQYKEDEKDCFALTNGKEIHLDRNKQPKFNNAGVFSRNTHGVWRVVCTHETGFHIHSAKTVDEVCALMGFKGFHFYNTTEITHHTIVPIEPNLQMAYLQDPSPVGDSVHFADDSKRMHVPYVASSLRERVEKTPDHNCLGLYVECVPNAKGSAPLKNLIPAEEISPKVFDIHGHKPNVSAVVMKKTDKILDELNKLIETKKAVLVHDKLHKGVVKWHWPWLVDVYTNGKLWCFGVLVDKYWVLVHDSCYYDMRLDRDYVTVLLGGGKSKDTLHKSPHEQIKRVDCIAKVENSNILLLHLDYAAHFTSHVLPAFLPDNIPLTAKENEKTLDKPQLECMSVVRDKSGGIKVTPTVEKSAKNRKESANNASSTMCGEDNELSCYQWDPTGIVDFKLKHLGEETAASVKQEEAKSLSGFCKDLDSNTNSLDNQAILVCREAESGWYPKAFYTFNSSIGCNNLKKPFHVQTLEAYYGRIQDIIDQPKCGNGYPSARLACPTLRCPLGNCLLHEQMCNGKVDCHDGSDEEKEMCRLHRNECKASELKCRSSGKCIPKTKFCDHTADCEDLTDEPTICSCFTYLQATDPSKICDGIRNCWDKSDESPVLCNCTSNRFPCGSSPSECIPKDFVCDKEPDCPNGEDEHFCYGIEHPINSPIDGSHDSSKRPTFPAGYGQVIEQTYGVWHTKCFPRQRPPDSAEVAEICQKLGYYGSKPPSYRLIDDSADIVAAAEVQDGITESPAKYRDATKAVVINKFSPIHLNEDLTLILKPSRPIAELVKWNHTDSSNCYRLEIKCG